jgi:raffinose/stachyose/melibiose transport system substrate-binding protein
MRWFSRRRVLAAVVGGAAIAAATVTVGGATSPAVAANTTSGSFTLAMNLAYKPGFDVLIKNFNTVYPNITITPSYYSVSGSASYETVVPTELSAGNAPDVLWTVGGKGAPIYTQVVAGAGYLKPLDGQPAVTSIPPGSRSQYTVGKHIYSSELGTTVFSTMVYNTDYFKAHGLKVPQTFPQLLNLCKAISSQGHYISYGAIGVGGTNQNNIESLAVSTVYAKDPKWYQKRLAHKVTFEGTPGWHTALEDALAMQKANCFQPGFTSINFAQMAQQFASGQAVVLWTVPILLGDILQLDPKIHFGMFAPPVAKAGQDWVMVQPQGGMSVNNKASAAATAAGLKFINFVATKKQENLFDNLNFLISDYDVTGAKLPPAYAGLTPEFKAKHYINIPDIEAPNSTFNTNFGVEIQGLFTGQKSVDQVLKDLDTDFNAKA